MIQKEKRNKLIMIQKEKRNNQKQQTREREQEPRLIVRKDRITGDG